MAYSKARRLADLIRSDGTIDTTKILDATIAAADIANDAITADKIVDNIALPGNITTSGTLAPVGVLTANAGLVVDNITIDGTQIDLSSGDLTLDVAGNINLDADGGSIFFKDAGTEFFKVRKVGTTHVQLYSAQNNVDIKFEGVDDGVGFAALTLDMSDAGTASFNHDVNVAGDLAVTGAVAITGGISGNPTTTTQSASDNTTKIATTAYVTTAVSNLVDGAPSTLNTLNEIAAALNDDAALNTTLTNSIATKAPLANPTFTGIVVAPDLTVGATSDSNALIQMLANPTNGKNTIHFGDATSGNASYTGFIEYAHATNKFTIGTNGGAERFSIDSTGKVRIGATLTSNHLLNIQTASTSGLAQMEFRNTAAGTQIGMPANTNALIFKVADNERMRITGPAAAEDRVGIGGDPTARLHLIGNSDVSDEDVMLKIQDNDSSAGSKLPAIGFYGGTTLQGRIRGSDSGMFISASANNNDDLTILSSGNVGIGISNPTDPLVVKSSGSIGGGATNANSYFTVTDGTYGLYHDPNEIFSDIDGVFHIGANHSNGALRFQTGGTATRMDIDSNGNVVIADGDLYLGAGSGQTFIEIAAGTTNAKTWRIYNGISWNPDALLIYNHTNDATALTIEPGKLGVGRGASSLTQNFEVSGTGLFTGIVAINKAINGSVGLSVGSDASSATSYGLEVCNSSSNTRFLVDGLGSQRFYGSDNSETARFTNGKLGIGTNDPQDTLHVVTNSSTTNDTVDVLRIEANSSGTPATGFGPVIEFRGERGSASADSMGRIGFVADTMTSSRIDGAFVVETAIDGTFHERMRIASGGALELGSHLTINNPGSDRKLSFLRTGGKQFSLEHDSAGFYFWNVTDSSVHTRFTNAGFVGINESNPSRTLHVNGPDGSTNLSEGNSRTALFLDNAGATYQNFASANNANAGIFFSDTDANNRGAVLYKHGSDALAFTTAAVERMEIDSAGDMQHQITADWNTGYSGTSDTFATERRDMMSAIYRLGSFVYAPGAYSNGNYYNGFGIESSGDERFVQFKIRLVNASQLYCESQIGNSADGTSRTHAIDYSFNDYDWTQLASGTNGAGTSTQDGTINFKANSGANSRTTTFTGTVHVRFTLEGGSSGHTTLIGLTRTIFRATADSMDFEGMGGEGHGPVEGGMWTLANASTIVSANQGFVNLNWHGKGHQNFDIFETIGSGNYGVKIKKAGRVQVMLDQDIITTGSTGYFYTRIYRSPSNHANNAIMAYSLGTSTNGQWDMARNQAIFDVEAGDIIQFFIGCASITSLDQGSWSQYSIQWFDVHRTGRQGRISTYLPNAHAENF